MGILRKKKSTFGEIIIIPGEDGDPVSRKLKKKPTKITPGEIIIPGEDGDPVSWKLKKKKNKIISGEIIIPGEGGDKKL